MAKAREVDRVGLRCMCEWGGAPSPSIARQHETVGWVQLAAGVEACVKVAAIAWLPVASWFERGGGGFTLTPLRRRRVWSLSIDRHDSGNGDVQPGEESAWTAAPSAADGGILLPPAL